MKSNLGDSFLLFLDVVEVESKNFLGIEDVIPINQEDSFGGVKLLEILKVQEINVLVVDFVFFILLIFSLLFGLQEQNFVQLCIHLFDLKPRFYYFLYYPHKV